jgi:hypothetical protein
MAVDRERSTERWPSVTTHGLGLDEAEASIVLVDYTVLADPNHILLSNQTKN